jgi:hypothetical protein
MKTGPGFLIGLLVCIAVPAAEPEPVAASREPLKLGISDIRKYMMPKDFQAAVSEPDADRNTVIVQANTPLLPVKYLKPIPTAPIAPFWALLHPLQSWKIFVPDLNRPPSGPPEVVPPPEFRRGP